ncbi:hypothetical protein XENORESO_009156 [Xenotaenia resolanae]|uniref:Uncharacterized protein n=1 Tax=Xenotaenia resolanae TaxID=208358 RepID=A0ABV0W6A5_9TELE
MVVVIVPSGNFFFTKTEQKKVDLVSHPRTNIKQYIQVSGCYHKGGGGELFPVAQLFSAKTKQGLSSPKRCHELCLLSSQLCSTSRENHGTEGRAAMGKGDNSSPQRDP